MFASPRILSVALAATLVVAACGSDGGDDADSADTTVAATTPETTPDTTTADTTPETTQAPEQDVEADTATAQTSLLTLAELPEGWTEAPAAETSELAGLLADCVGVDSLTSLETNATSGAFASADGGLVVVQSVGIQPTERDARGVTAQFTNPSVPDCMAEAYTAAGATALNSVADDAEIGEVTATRLAVGAAGDATQAVRVTIPVTSGDATTPVNVDIVVVRAGESLSALTFEGAVEPTAVETIDEITAAAAARLPA